MRRRIVSTKIYRIGLVIHLSVLLATIIAASAGWLPDVRDLHRHADKIGHAFFFGLAAFFLDGSLRFRRLWAASPSWLRLGPTIAIVLAAIEETVQIWSPHRDSDVFDFVADVMGIVLLSALGAWVARRRGPSPR